MGKIVKTIGYFGLFRKVSALLEQARGKTVRQVNTIIVETYWKIGQLIVVEEQKGKEKAVYGEKLLERLSKDLTRKYGKGFSADNLEAMRKFYLVYPRLSKSETVSRKFQKGKISSKLPSDLLIERVSWSHIRELISIKDDLTRSFYEIETVKNGWSVRELKRQIDSMLYERISLRGEKGSHLHIPQNHVWIGRLNQFQIKPLTYQGMCCIL